MLLADKNAVIYGAAGAGRSVAKVDAVAEEIVAAGGQTDTAQVDALDKRAVDEHAAEVAKQAGSIDVSFDAIGIDHVQGVPLTELSLEDYSLGPYGVRVVCLGPDAIPETASLGSHTRMVWTRAAEPAGMTLEQVLDASPGAPGALLARSPVLDEVANVAAFLASDQASGMTATITNISCGAIVD
jgi:enoyl-[acyl-carrier-protein] reductase (NADH)